MTKKRPLFDRNKLRRALVFIGFHLKFLLRYSGSLRVVLPATYNSMNSLALKHNPTSVARLGF